MILQRLHILFRSTLLVVVAFCMMSFTVVIDAGHGGNDAGAIGLVKGVKEKDLNLTVAQRLAAKIRQSYPEVKVVLTRDTDVFPGWRPRPCPAAPAVRACRPLPAAAGLSSSSRACDRPALPSPVWGRAGLASCGCRSPGLRRPVASPRRGGARGALRVWGTWGPPVRGGRAFSLAGLRLSGVCRWRWA